MKKTLKNTIEVTLDESNPQHPYLVSWVNRQQGKTYEMHCSKSAMDSLVEKYSTLI